MNKRLVASLLFVPLFALSSCSGGTGLNSEEMSKKDLTIDEAQAIIDGFVTPAGTFNFTCNYYVSIGGSDEESQYSAELVYGVPTETNKIPSGMTKSKISRVPMYLNGENFYILKSGILSVDGCVYGILKDKAIYANGSTSVLSTKARDNGGVTFYVDCSSTYIAVPMGTEMDNAYGRFNFVYRYDSRGFLESEYIQQIETKKGDKGMDKVYAESSYTYSIV